MSNLPIKIIPTSSFQRRTTSLFACSESGDAIFKSANKASLLRRQEIFNSSYIFFILACLSWCCRTAYSAEVKEYWFNNGFYDCKPNQNNPLSNYYINGYGVGRDNFHPGYVDGHNDWCGDDGANSPPGSSPGTWRNQLYGNPAHIKIPSSQIQKIFLTVDGNYAKVGETVTVWSIESSMQDLQTAPSYEFPGSITQVVFDDLENGQNMGTFPVGLSPNWYEVEIPSGSVLNQFIREKLTNGSDFALGCAKTQAHNFLYNYNYLFTNLVVRSIVADPIPVLIDAQGLTAPSPKCDTCTDATSPGQSSADPVRFADGALEMWEDDLESTSTDGLSFRRSYSNLIGHPDGELGQSWTTSVAPRIIRAGGSYIVRLQADRQVGFTQSAGPVYTAIRSGRETLIQQASGDLVFADPLGMVLVFHGFDNGLPTRQQGRLRRLYTQGGSPLVSTYDASGFVQDARRTTISPEVEERLSFTYDPASGLLTGAQRQRIVNGGAPEIVRQVSYGYDGTVNQLRSVVVKDGAGAVLRRFHYRYYTTAETGSSLGQVKLAIGPRNYERLLGLGTPIDPLAPATTDAQLLPYADKVFQYDANRRVTQQLLQTADVDGSGTYIYAYAPRTTPAPPVPPGPNDWLMRFTETRPDSSTNTVFTNQGGDVLFRQTATAAGVVVAADAYVYNSDWRIQRHVTGAALQPASGGGWYDTNLTDLLGHGSGDSVYIKNDTGLIESWTYYPSTGGGAGSAPGYVQSEWAQQGEQGTGTLTLLKSYTYVAHAAP